MEKKPHFNKGKKYYKLDIVNVLKPELFDKIRHKLQLTKKELPDSKIKKVCKLSNDLIGDWIIKNPDGFQIKDAGRIAVSKWMPKCLRGDKDEKIEAILNRPMKKEYLRKVYLDRYKKGLDHYKKYEGEKMEGYHTHIESFFYLYRILWFNARNCNFEKAEIYQFKPARPLRKKLVQSIREGKQYFEWNFSDFRQKKDKKRRKKETE